MMFHVERWQNGCHEMFHVEQLFVVTKLFHVEQEVLTTVNLFL